MCSFKQFSSRLNGLPRVAGQDCRWKKLVIIIFRPNFFLKNDFLGKALKSSLFAVLSSGLKQTYFFYEKKTYLIDVNWLYISCNVTKKKKSAESSKQDDCY